jgi:hypothetical protein
MKERGNTTKSLLIAVAILGAIGFGGYAYINRDASVSTDLLVAESAGASGLDGDLLKALQQLKTIKLNTNIFQDPVFRSFFDFGTTIQRQETGRQNPFAPVGVSSTVSAPASSASAPDISAFE